MVAGRVRGAVLATAGLVLAGTPAGVAGAQQPPLLGQALPAEVITASAEPGADWSPDPPRYGVGKQSDLHVRMADGVMLRADVYYPTEGGRRADGEFPVAMTMTPYSRQSVGLTPEPVIGTDTGGPNEYLVRRGYLSVVVDVRGTGASEGSLGAGRTADGMTYLGAPGGVW